MKEASMQLVPLLRQRIARQQPIRRPKLVGRNRNIKVIYIAELSPCGYPFVRMTRKSSPKID